MPLPVAHGLLGASIVAALHPQPTRRRYSVPLLFGALLANAADLDFLLVFALHSRSWHRGLTHSVVFALLVGLLSALLLGRRRLKEALAYGLAFASHGVLDYVTSKEGGGVELLWPFSAERMMLGWWGLSEVPSKLPPSGIMKALAVESGLFTPPLLAALLLRKAVARGAKSAEGAT
ncbi:MAG: metal-dependent hydrolase [Acidobacteriota bacterium]|nr:metal-dependent hydrolase [Acidobacteriota bacterium]